MNLLKIILLLHMVFITGCGLIMNPIIKRDIDKRNEKRQLILPYIRQNNNHMLRNKLEEINNNSSHNNDVTTRLPPVNSCVNLLHYSIYNNNKDAFDIIYNNYINRLISFKKIMDKHGHQSFAAAFLSKDFFDINKLFDALHRRNISYNMRHGRIQFSESNRFNSLFYHNLIDAPDCIYPYNFYTKTRAPYRDDSQETVYGSRLIHIASEYGNVEMFKYLLKLGASTNIYDFRLEIKDKYKQHAKENRIDVARGYTKLNFMYKLNHTDPYNKSSLEYIIFSSKATLVNKKEIINILLKPRNVKFKRNLWMPYKVNTEKSKSIWSDEKFRQLAKNRDKDTKSLVEAYIRYRYWSEEIKKDCEKIKNKKMFVDNLGAFNDLISIGRKDKYKRSIPIKIGSMHIDQKYKNCKNRENMEFVPIKFWLGFPSPE